MIKEELEKEAKEWIKNNNYPYSNCPNIEKKLKQAYLAGAEPREKHIAELEKENAELKKSRWHNLRKNPQDLPKEDSAVLVVDMDYGHPGYKVALFWKKDGTFTGHYLAKLDVIAWREIPVFQEEA